MKVKTSELTGVALDWSVAQATNVDVKIINGYVCEMNIDGGEHLPCAYYTPSSDWSRCGALIDNFNVWLSSDEGVLHASCEPHMGGAIKGGPNQKVAICRAVVAAKLGDEVELPAELIKGEGV